MALSPPANAAFLHGVASGDPRADRVILWTRVTAGDGEPVEVQWQLAAGLEVGRQRWATTGQSEHEFGTADGQQMVAEGSVLASADADHTVHVDVSGLQPGTRYVYRFSARGQVSPVGHTRTLPSAGCERVRFAQVCCAKLNMGYFNAYARIAEREDLDFVLHLGDYIYETEEHAAAQRLSTTVPERAYDPPHECRTLDDYRRRYAHYRRDADLQRLHQALPLIATLDDHEVADGAWRDGAEDYEDRRHGDWAERRRAALQARWEWLPLRMPDPSDPDRVYGSSAVGDLADLIWIDARLHRDRPADGTGLADAARSALGREQLTWLLAELDKSTAAWRIIGSPTLMATMRGENLPQCVEALRTLKLINPRNDGPDPDPWAGYPHERELILGHLAACARKNVVFLSGDVHVSIAAELSSCETPSAPVAVELVTPSITSQNLDDKTGRPPRSASPAIEQALVAGLPGLRWCELDSHGYVIVDVTRERVRAEWWFVDAINRPSARERRAAAWQVAAGTAQLSAGDQGPE